MFLPLIRNIFLMWNNFFDPATREGNFLGKPLGRSASPQSKMTIIDGSSLPFPSLPFPSLPALLPSFLHSYLTHFFWGIPKRMFLIPIFFWSGFFFVTPIPIFPRSPSNKKFSDSHKKGIKTLLGSSGNREWDLGQHNGISTTRVYLIIISYI